MEREKEIQKLINVLRKTARLAQQASWAGQDSKSAAFSVDQYNRVLSRLVELDPNVSSVFQPLEDDESLSVVIIASRQLAAYFEDETRSSHSFGKTYGAAFDTEAFKDFWKQSARDIEDLGEFIRENLETWANQQKKSASASESKADKEE